MAKIKGLFNRIKSSDFIRNILTMMSGSIIGYVINLVTLPIISRIYSTSEVGGYDLIISTSKIFISVMQLALILVIVIPKEDREANRVCKIIFDVTFLGSIGSVLFLMAMSSRFQLFDINIGYSVGLLLFGLYLVIYNTQAIFYSYANRKKLYRVLFWNPILIAIFNGGLTIVFGMLHWGTVGYMLGTISAYAVAIVHMHRYIRPFEGRDNPRELWATLKRFKKYPLVQLPANLTATIALQVPSQFLGRMFSAAVLGGFTMAGRILSVPVSLLATPVNKVYYRTLVEKINDEEDAGDFAFSLLKNNIRIAIIPIGLLIIFGDIIAGFFLGEEWRVSGTYISITGFMYLLKYCNSCMSGTMVGAGKPKLSMIYSVVSLSLQLVCFGIVWILGFGAMQAIIIYTVFAACSELVGLFLNMYCLNYPLRKMVGFVLRYIVVSAVVIYALLALRTWIGAQFF